MLLYKNGGFSLLRYLQDKRQLLNFLAVLTPTVNLVHLKLFEVYCTHVIFVFDSEVLWRSNLQLSYSEYH